VMIFAVIIAALAAKTAVETNWLIFIAVLLPFYIFFALRKPFLFLFGLYVFLLPFDSILVVGREEFGPTVTKFLGVVSIVVLFLKAFQERKLKKPENAVLWWGLFVLFGALSFGWGLRPDLIQERIPTAIGLYLLYLIVSCYGIKREEFEKLLTLIVWGGICAAAYSIYSYYFLHISFLDSERSSLIVGGRAEDPNQLVFALSIPLALLMGKFLASEKRVFKVLWFIALAIVLYATLIAGSRGGILGIATIFFIFALSRLKKKTSLIIAITLMLSSAFLLLPEIFFERMSKMTIVSQMAEGNRLSIWMTGLDIFKDSWLLGVGIDGFPTAYLTYAGSLIGLGPDSNYVGVLAEMGIIGIAIFLGSMYKHFSLLKKRFFYRDYLSVTLTAMGAGLSIEGGLLDTLWRKSFWLLWMLIMMYKNLENEKRPYP